MKISKYILIATLIMFAFSCEQTPAPIIYDNITEDPLYKEYSDDMHTLFVGVKPNKG